ncbi:bifunctional hydroxymethylpyrimidine kinase/phosphomethylpyrimidine kinase [Atopobacter phocae]|uniref:bifunctional hydroxymethylpyrimidine kinase/phosphomethylpyrimidine kinase n=1 Tax=Atopobacter phocae TaxID=136492 RepID=UPI000472F063|nr:bifunctional hydroxymethylpyrimidine kinase/phosphomethylpyrimidine kinase [Atopobacter phocae]
MHLLVVNDLPVFGRVAGSVSYPLFSHMGIQTSLLPTCLLESHLGYTTTQVYPVNDLFEHTLTHAKQLEVPPNVVMTGLFHDKEQIDCLVQYIDDQHLPLYVDPIMGDNGRYYRFFKEPFVSHLLPLIQRAQLLTPNLTEACFIADIPYDSEPGHKFLNKLFQRLLAINSTATWVITGVPYAEQLITWVIRLHPETQANDFQAYPVKRLDRQATGMGDVYGQLIVGLTLNKRPISESIPFAQQFISKSLEQTNVPFEGLVYEPYLTDIQTFLSTD